MYVSGYVIVVALIPLFFLIYYSFHVSFSRVFVQVLLASVKQSVVQATVSTAVSLPMGLFFGTLLIIYSGRMKSTLISLLLVTYVLPGIIMSLGIISLFGFSSRFWEIIYGNVIYNAPMIAVLAFSTGYSTNIREVYSARTLGASDAQIVTRFYLPNTLRGGLTRWNFYIYTIV